MVSASLVTPRFTSSNNRREQTWPLLLRSSRTFIICSMNSITRPTGSIDKCSRKRNLTRLHPHRARLIINNTGSLFVLGFSQKNHHRPLAATVSPRVGVLVSLGGVQANTHGRPHPTIPEGAPEACQE